MQMRLYPVELKSLGRCVKQRQSTSIRACAADCGNAAWWNPFASTGGSPREAAAWVDGPQATNSERNSRRALGTCSLFLFRVPSAHPTPHLPGIPQPSQSQRGAKALAFWPGHNLQFSPQRGPGSHYSAFQRRFFFSGVLPGLLAHRLPVAFLHLLQPVPN